MARLKHGRFRFLRCGLTAALLAGCSGGASESSPDPGATSPAMTAAPSVESAPQDNVEPPWPEASSEVVVLSPTMLHRILQIQKHRGKVIETTGVVDVLFMFGPGNPQPISLTTDDEFDPAHCLLAEVDCDLYAKIAPGQTVTLRTVESRPQSPRDWRWELISYEPNRLPRLDAESLAGEFEADPESADLKYEKRWLYVTGEVAGPASSGEITLKGAGKVVVTCNFGPQADDLARSKVGNRIQFLARYASLLSDEDEIFFGPCHLLHSPLPPPVPDAMDGEGSSQEEQGPSKQSATSPDTSSVTEKMPE